MCVNEINIKMKSFHKINSKSKKKVRIVFHSKYKSYANSCLKEEVVW